MSNLAGPITPPSETAQTAQTAQTELHAIRREVAELKEMLRRLILANGSWGSIGQAARRLNMNVDNLRKALREAYDESGRKQEFHYRGRVLCECTGAPPKMKRHRFRVFLPSCLPEVRR